MSTTPLFTGSSRYSEDFKQVIERAVSIASLPLTQLTNQQTLLAQKQTAYYSLKSKITTVGTAVQSLVNALGANSYSVSSSKSTAATATTTNGALAGTYTLNVIDTGSYARAMGVAPDAVNNFTKVTDPETQNFTSGLTFTLSVGGEDKTITAKSATLSSLVTAINEAGLGVQATMVNVGTNGTPDFRLSLQSNDVGETALHLTAGTTSYEDGGTGVLSTLATGSLAKYKINGQPSAADEYLTSTSRTLTIAPGVTATLLDVGETNITVTRSTQTLATALTSLVSAYNTAMDELNQHRGQNDGILSGDSEIGQLAADLRRIINYSDPASSPSSLIQLGLSFDQTGLLSLDTTQLGKFSVSNLSDFFGDGATTGFITHAKSILKAIDGSSESSLQTTITSLSTQLQRTSDRIESEQTRIDVLKENLNEKMAAADALVAALEQQASYFTSLFAAMKSNSDSYNS